MKEKLTDIVGRFHQDFRFPCNLGEQEGVFLHGQQQQAGRLHLLGRLQVAPGLPVLGVQEVAGGPDDVEEDFLDESFFLVELVLPLLEEVLHPAGHRPHHGHVGLEVAAVELP